MSPFLTLDREKLPPYSVITPLVVPFTTTEVPITGPIASITVPVAVSLCCTTGALIGAALVVAIADPVDIANKHSIKLTDLNCFVIVNFYRLKNKVMSYSKFSKYLYKFVDFPQHTGTKLQVFLTINNFYRQILSTIY
jgi:hypothetical protein